MGNAFARNRYGTETTTADETARPAEAASGSRPVATWHTAGFSGFDMVKPEVEGASLEESLGPIDDAWLANVFEIQVSEKGRVFSFVPPDDVRRAMEQLVQTEMLSSLVRGF